MSEIPSESERILTFAASHQNIAIHVCDLTASCTFRWHHRLVLTGKPIHTLVEMLLDRTQHTAVANWARWKRDYQTGVDPGLVLNAITNWIEATQVPIYWHVSSLVGRLQTEEPAEHAALSKIPNAGALEGRL